MRKVKNNSLFFQSTDTVKILIHLQNSEGTFIRKLALALDITYSHVFNILKNLNRMDLIIIKKEGRITKLYLTEKGKIVSKEFINFMDLLKN